MTIIRQILTKIENKIIKSFLSSIVILSITVSFFIFDDFWEYLINNLLVNPIISHLIGNEWWIIILYELLILSYYHHEYLNAKSENTIRVKFVSISIVLYFICFVSDKWEYSSIIKGCNLTAWANIPLLSLFLGEIILYLKFTSINKRQTASTEESMEVEKTVDVVDSYKRTILALSTYECLKDSFFKECSFTLSITGDWGSGKTTFMNLLKDQYKTNNAASSIIEFEAWKNDSPDSIIKSFFTQLKNELKLYIPGISSSFDQYIELLLDEESTKPLKVLTKLVCSILNKNVDSPYLVIQEKLRETRHKTVVFIDDLDRLNANEIREILRLVRNTANFPYLQFIIAADKRYVCNMLKSLGVDNGNLYLEKFFNLEIPLPSNEYYIICNELYDRIRIIIHNIWGTGVDDLYISNIIYYNPDENANNIIAVPIVARILHSVRDVIRFRNSFYLIAKVYKEQGIENEIEFQELLFLELMRYRYPEVYFLLCSQPLSLLNMNDTANFNFSLNENLDVINSIIHNDEERETVLSILNLLFAKNSSIRNIRHYYSYFRFRQDDKILRLDEFLAMEDKDEAEISYIYKQKYRSEFNNFISSILNKLTPHQYNVNKLPGVDYAKIYNIIIKLCGYKFGLIREEVSECVITHLNNLYCTDSFHLKCALRLYNHVNFSDFTLPKFGTDEFIRTLLFKDELSRRIKEYEKEKEEAKSVVHNFFLSVKNPLRISSALSRFVIDVITARTNLDSLTIDLNTISEIQMQYFRDYTDKLSSEGYELFDNCRIYSPRKNPRHPIIRKEAIEIMRAEIRNNPEQFFKMFISYSYKKDPNTVYISRWKIFFTSPRKFDRFLSSCNTGSDLEERVKNYWRLYKYNGYKPLEFDSSINVPEIIKNNFRDEIRQLNELIEIRRQIRSQIKLHKKINQEIYARVIAIKLDIKLLWEIKKVLRKRLEE